MKCETCKNAKFHFAGSFRSVAEGNDDPYNYAYCAAGHWVDGPENEPEPAIDPWENCQDYRG